MPTDRDVDSSAEDEPNQAETPRRAPTQSSSQSKTTNSKTTATIAAGLVALACVAGAAYWAYDRYVATSNSERVANVADDSEDSSQRPPTPVTATKAKDQTWSNRLSAIGTVRAIQETELTTGLAGRVDQIKFESGDAVAKGALLLRLDTEREQAKLVSLKTQLRQAGSDQRRAKKLVGEGAVSTETYEETITEVDRLRAEIARQLAIIDRREVKAPFAGKLGIRMVDLGQLVSPGTPITTLQTLSPIYVDFEVPEEAFDKINIGQEVVVGVAAHPEIDFLGSVQAVAPRVQQPTRSFTVRAQFANEDRYLRPGMFASVVVRLTDELDVVTVPRSAISFNAFGTAVYVVEEQDESLLARQRFVVVGESRAKSIAITDGLNAGERVITSGQIKLSDGSPVKIVDQTALADAPEIPADP